MNNSDRKLAEAVLNRLFCGSTVTGLRFFTPQILLDGPKDIPQEGIINLTSEWGIFNSPLDEFPESFEQLTQEEEEIKIHNLRGEEVQKVEIASPWPHLMIFFKSGKVLYLNGHEEVYEPWTAGLTNFGNTKDEWQVVACPGGGLAVWAPKGWDGGKNV